MTLRAPQFKSRPQRRLQQAKTNYGLGPGMTTADTAIRYEIVPVFGQSVITVRAKVTVANAKLDLVQLGPDFDCDVGNTAFASLAAFGTLYTTLNPTQVLLTAGVENALQTRLFGEHYVLIKLTGSGGTSTITFVDVMTSDAVTFP